MPGVVLLAACAGPAVKPVDRVALSPQLTVEVVGLRRWTVQMMDDSLAKYAPGESLADHACVGNLRDKQVMAKQHPRTVDWSSVAPVIHDVLDGTSLPTLVPLIYALLATGVDERSAKTYLRHGGEMLTALLEVTTPEIADPAHQLLVKLRGADLGRSPAGWREWIASL